MWLLRGIWPGDETCISSALQVPISGAAAGGNWEPPVERQPEISEEGVPRWGFKGWLEVCHPFLHLFICAHMCELECHSTRVEIT